MLAPQNETPPAAGLLDGFENGRLTGEVIMQEAMAGQDGVAVEVFAHGILAASGTAKVEDRQPGQPIPFSIPVKRFPRVSLPCPLSARVASTDTPLECDLTVETLDGLWQAMLPFRVRVARVTRGHILLEATGRILHPDTEIFELREAGDMVGLSEPEGSTAGENTLFSIPLSEQLLDGDAHKLFVIHRGSNLPVNIQPISVALNLEVEPQPSLADMLGRLEAIERQMRERYAEAFNGLALGLYQHIDTVALKQRSNFEREISTLRRLLGAGEPETGGTPVAPATVTLSFADEVKGYGISPLYTTNTGKTFRYAAPRSGFMLSPCAPGAARLVIQGIRRCHPDALRDARLFVNGDVVGISPYLSPRSDSWNITTELPDACLRGEGSNLIELRLPNGSPPDAPTETDLSVGILEITLESHPGQPEDAATAPADA